MAEPSDRVVVLSPHPDDDMLFCAFTLLGEVESGSDVRLVTVLQSEVQAARGTGITAQQRACETAAALIELGLTECDRFVWDPWRFNDLTPDWDAIADKLRRWALVTGDLAVTRVYAPFPEPGGHHQHNRIGEVAQQAFGARCIGYLTYTTAGKSTWGRPVPYNPAWVTKKLRALACYRSQIETPGAMSTEHFLREQFEYVAAPEVS